ncbi:MAG: asparagine synthase (glutamine-hydrolyzing) [Halieaceae bacterium]|jgi:asparagine synthase (glutamine-hydrolysing)|nr:asparagine synthase (glutamine-hydrolyzing) [Halieaceae bacterium]
MCGVSAIFSSNANINPSDLISMTRAVLHRGPDDGGFIFINKSETSPPTFVRDKTGSHPQSYLLERIHDNGQIQVALGHRRLSIVDLGSGGLQPMSFQDGRYWATYNGEIYNHIELRHELIGLGHSFRSTSDTEVLLAAYAQWGNKCLKRLNGMFAFVIFDCQTKTVFTARDRFGVKPLYYWVARNGNLHFASEIKQFTGLPEWRSQLNGERAYDFLAWGLSDHTRETTFRGVFQLLPGHQATFNLKTQYSFPPKDRKWPAEQKWYEISKSCVKASMEEASEELYRLLTNSISLRLRSDVTIGANLSGGIDSSTIVCLINQLQEKSSIDSEFHCLSAFSGYPEFDERQYAEQVLGRVNAKPVFVKTSFEELEEDIAKLVWHQDEPFASTSIYAEWCIYREAAHSGIKVMLGGQGADEQLAGYPEHVGHFYRGWLRNKSYKTMLSDIIASHQQRGTPWSAIMIRLLDALMPQPLRQSLRKTRGAGSQNPGWLCSKLLNVVPHDPFDALGYREASVRGASRIQLQSTNLPMQLRWEDRDSMAHSVESRAPFLDVELVDFLYGLPDEYRYFKGESKRLLRNTFRGVVPNEIIDRRDKMGFVTPEAIWIQKQGKHFFRNAVENAINASNGIIKPEALTHFTDMINGKRRFSHSLWRVVSYGMWLERFSVRNP